MMDHHQDLEPDFGQPPQAPLPQQEDHHQDPSLMDHRQDLESDLGQPL